MKFSNNTLMYLAYGLIAVFFIILMMRNMSFQASIIEGMTDKHDDDGDSDDSDDDSDHEHKPKHPVDQSHKDIDNKNLTKNFKIIKKFVNNNDNEFTNDKIKEHYKKYKLLAIDQGFENLSTIIKNKKNSKSEKIRETRMILGGLSTLMKLLKELTPDKPSTTLDTINNNYIEKHNSSNWGF